MIGRTWTLTELRNLPRRNGRTGGTGTRAGGQVFLAWLRPDERDAILMVVISIWGPAPRNPVSRLHEIGLEAVQIAQLVRGLLD